MGDHREFKRFLNILFLSLLLKKRGGLPNLSLSFEFEVHYFFLYSLLAVFFDLNRRKDLSRSM